ncbi:ARID DNA-binding domain-containing protein [Tanacetum coccineum]|uniref:ARID DNA-binding domain-containing protein n=1 Tax=Tanacetum coccineum TaxID=301880 RepID=A0ABQ4WH94_9ASTR
MNSNQTMVNYKRILETNWLWHKPVQQWYQSGRSKSWEKLIHNRMQKGFEKGYLLREGAANTLPRNSRAAVKEKGEGSAYKKHMSPTKSLFKRLKNSFKVEGTQHERKLVFSHGIGEAIVETSEKKIVIPCTTSVRSPIYLKKKGKGVMVKLIVKHPKEGNGCNVETESMIAKHNKYLEEYFDSIDSKDECLLIKGLEELKWDRNIVQDSLDEDYISVNGTLYAIKFYLIYLKQDALEPLPPVIWNVKIDLLGLYKMVDSMGGYLSVSFGNRWKEVADTTLRPCFKEEPMKCEKTKKVDGGCDHAKEENPQEHDGSSKNGLGVVRENTHEYFENVQRSETRFGVILECNNDTDFDQMSNQEDGANISETNDFVVIT